jgi:Xaa-Pro aminopeptidase
VRRSSSRQATDTFAERRSLVAAGLGERKLDALLVGIGPNLRYLTGFTGSNGLLLVTPRDAIFWTDPRYAIQVTEQVSCRAIVAKGALLPQAVVAVKRRSVRRLGFEKARTTYEQYETLRDSMPVKSSLQPVVGWIEKMRMVKSADEIAAIRAAVALNSQAFDETVPQAKAGMREIDLAAELEYRMRRLGAEKPAFETIVASGPRSAKPHADPSLAPIRPKELVVVDMGAQLAGYASDMTRMLHVGDPSPKTRRAYRAVLEAQLAALDAVRAGVTADRVDRAARSVLRGFGLDREFTHSTGHGLGLEIHEPPRLGKRDKTVLEPGMAITIEPGVYLQGFGGIRIEDTVVVTENGCEILTPTSKDLRIV